MMTIDPSKSTFSTNNQIPVDEKKIIKSALGEAINRIKLKFPGRVINDHEVQFNKITPKNFSDGSLDCGRGGFTTLEVVQGYIIEFTYNHETYHLHTKEGETFLSPDLNFEPYPGQLFNHLKTALSNKINEKIVIAEDINLKKVINTEGTAQTYKECNNDFDKYFAQREEVLIFQVSYKNEVHEFCMNSKGEPRHELL